MNRPVWVTPSCTGHDYFCAEHENFMNSREKHRLLTKEDFKSSRRGTIVCKRCLYLEGASWGRLTQYWYE